MMKQQKKDFLEATENHKMKNKMKENKFSIIHTDICKENLSFAEPHPGGSR